MSQAPLPAPSVRTNFAANMRDELAQCFMSMGRNEEAQKWMEEANAIRTKNGLGRNSQFAGRVQAASGAHVVENEIKAEEKTQEDNPNYWLERARYYAGRNQPADEEQAFKKALALTKPEPEPAHSFKGNYDVRAVVLGQYAGFFLGQHREAEGVALLRKELAEAPADAASAKQAAHRLAFDFTNYLKVDDAVLWRWLEIRPQWESNEERLLWEMLKRANQGELDKYLTHAEELALNVDPTRAATLGWVENRMQLARRSLPLLQYAVANAKDDELRQRWTFTLLESYLDTGDWKHAEEVFPTASKRLTDSELPQWYGRIAVVAAKAGDKDDALRMWKRVANYDLTCINYLDEMARAGLKTELTEFYREFGQKLPSSESPTMAIKTLQKS
jgi:tetratricopeptide (TPR) repeat protein